MCIMECYYFLTLVRLQSSKLTLSGPPVGLFNLAHFIHIYFLFAPTSRNIQNTFVIYMRRLTNPNHAYSHLAHNIRSSYQYHIRYQSEDLHTH